MRVLQSLSAAETRWLGESSYGPPGFHSYLRLMLLPDPDYPGQPQSTAEPVSDLAEMEVLHVALATLARFTRTADDIRCGIWQGQAPLRSPGPVALDILDRGFLVLAGSVEETITGGVEAALDPHGPLWPTLVWPRDRAWFVSNYLDVHWACIGSSTAAAQALRRAGLPVKETPYGVCHPRYDMPAD